VEYEDCKEDDKVGLGEGFMDFDISESTILGFVDRVFA
jgi:hypothetical protein